MDDFVPARQLTNDHLMLEPIAFLLAGFVTLHGLRATLIGRFYPRRD